jgi:hypothetical protein
MVLVEKKGDERANYRVLGAASPVARCALVAESTD